MTNVFAPFDRLKTVRKGKIGLHPSREWREALFSEYLGSEMLAKLNQVYRSRRKHGLWL